jgi:phosphoglycerate dehydrogenase-like enzyme
MWQQDPPPGGVQQLEGKRVGIVGLGAVGRQVAKRIAAFDAQVVAYQRNPQPAPEIPSEIQWVEFDKLLSESDVVILCVPLTEQTRGMVGARELGLMKKGAVLVNVARGQVVDEPALYVALASGHLRAAGLDVFVEEPTGSDNPLLRLENVMATPHIAGRSVEMEQNQIEATLKDLERIIARQRPRNVVNSQLLAQGSTRAQGLV